MAQPIIYRTPPLAGRPPYATDEPDSVYAQPASPTRRTRQQRSPSPNTRTSAYNVYDQYLDEKGNPAERGPAKRSMDDPFDDTNARKVQQQPIPLAAPQPGYAAPVAALNLSRPSPAATPEGRMPASPDMSEYPRPLTLVSQQTSIPNAPHPLQPPMTPISPIFARPSKSPAPRDVKFQTTQPILRSEKEETLLPRRGQNGDDFWRRFSMVAKEEKSQSTWLRKTQNGSTRMSRWVWIIGMGLLLLIIAAIALGWYFTHNDNSHTAPDALGGSANEKLSQPSSSAEDPGTHGPSSTSFHVSPTNTVARRDDGPQPTGLPLALDIPTEPINLEKYAASLRNHHSRTRRNLNRTSH